MRTKRLIELGMILTAVKETAFWIYINMFATSNVCDLYCIIQVEGLRSELVHMIHPCIYILCVQGIVIIVVVVVVL